MIAGGGAIADIVGDLGYASELIKYAEYSGAPNEDEVLQYARVVIDVQTHPIGSGGGNAGAKRKSESLTP